MKKFKLAFVISSLEIGGAEKMLLDLVNKLYNNLDIKIFVIKKNYGSIFDKKIKSLGLKIQYFNHRIKVFSLVVAIKLKKALKQFSPAVIHSHLKASTYVYFYHLFYKNFLWVHTIHTKPKIDTKRFRRLFFKPLYNNNKIKLIAVSEEIAAEAKLLYKNANIYIINNGIDLENFKYIKAQKLNLINVGRLEAVKNHRYLLREVRKLDQKIRINKLFLIGDGKQRNQIIKLIKTLDLENKVNLIYKTNKVNEYLNKSTIFILTSFYEGLSLALIEAMVSGLIVITASNANSVITDGYNGFVIDLEEDSLYLKLQEIIPKIDQYEYIRLNAVKTANGFSAKKMAQEYLDFYYEFL